jgi:hypothetical protein
MTRDVMDIVPAKANKDNMPSALKFTTKHGMILHDYAFIASVERERNNDTPDKEPYVKIVPGNIADS